MAEKRFIKFVPSEKSEWLQEHYPNAFLLLSQIARRARRTENSPDGREIGEAHIGDYKKAGIETEMKYRTAKKVLEELGYIRVVETRRRPQQRLKTDVKCKNVKNATTKVTTKGTLVKLLDSDIWDVNFSRDNECRNDRITTKQRLDNDEQECKERKEREEPPSPKGVSSEPGGGGLESVRKEDVTTLLNGITDKAAVAKRQLFERLQRTFGEALKTAHFETAYAEMREHAKRESIRNEVGFLSKKIDDYIIYGIPEKTNQSQNRDRWIEQNQREALSFASGSHNGVQAIVREGGLEIKHSRGLQIVSYALPPEQWEKETWMLRQKVSEA